MSLSISECVEAWVYILHSSVINVYKLYMYQHSCWNKSLFSQTTTIRQCITVSLILHHFAMYGNQKL